jgi:hypothetical protein
MAAAIRCPQCHARLLEVIIECTALSEVQLVIAPPELSADLAPFVVTRLRDGRGLVRWADFSARVLHR